VALADANGLLSLALSPKSGEGIPTTAPLRDSVAKRRKGFIEMNRLLGTAAFSTEMLFDSISEWMAWNRAITGIPVYAPRVQI